MYKEDIRSHRFNALVIGDLGTGKTTFACTGRKPVLLHSFDPGGPKSVQSLINEGLVIPDTRFANEDPNAPSQFQAWVEEMRRLERANVFEHVGTYVLDSATTFADALIGHILKRENRKQMEIRDWGTLLTEVKIWMRRILSLPCDCIVTGHLTREKDDITGKVQASMMISGQSSVKLPMLFDEVYVTQTTETPKGLEYRILTQNNGSYQARTRIGARKFAPYEEPNIKALLRKAGLPDDDVSQNEKEKS